VENRQTAFRNLGVWDQTQKSTQRVSVRMKLEKNVRRKVPRQLFRQSIIEYFSKALTSDARKGLFVRTEDVVEEAGGCISRWISALQQNDFG